MQSDVTSLDLGTGFVSPTSDLTHKLIPEPSLEGQLTDGPPVIKQRLSNDYNQLDEPILDTLLRDLNSIFQKIKIVSFPLSSYDIHKTVMRGWDLWGPLLLCTFLAFGLHHYDDKDNYSCLNFSDIFVLLWFGSYLISLNFRLLSISGGDHRYKSLLDYELEISSQGQKESHQQTKSDGDTVTTTVNEGQQAKSLSATNSGDKRMTVINMSSSAKSIPITSQAQQTTRRSLFCPPSLFQLMCVFGYSLVVPCIGLILLKTLPFSRLLFERVVVGLLFGFLWPTLCSVRILFRYQTPSKRTLAIYPIGLFYFVLSFMMIMDH